MLVLYCISRLFDCNHLSKYKLLTNCFLSIFFLIFSIKQTSGKKDRVFDPILLIPIDSPDSDFMVKRPIPIPFPIFPSIYGYKVTNILFQQSTQIDGSGSPN